MSHRAGRKGYYTNPAGKNINTSILMTKKPPYMLSLISLISLSAILFAVVSKLLSA